MTDYVTCPWCGGAGLLAPKGCNACDGRGNLLPVKPWPEMTATMARVECPHCSAVGRVEAEWRLETWQPEPYTLMGRTVQRRATAFWWVWAVCRACGWAERGEATGGPATSG